MPYLIGDTIFQAKKRQEIFLNVYSNIYLYISSLGLEKNIGIFFLVVFIFIFIIVRYSDVFALSPSFSRQEIPDPSHDASGLTKVFSKIIPNSNSNECILAETYHLLPSPPDIQEVDYQSNGTTFNGTIWLP